MSWIGPLLELLFTALFLRAVWDATRHQPLALDVALVFGALGAFSILAIAQALFGRPPILITDGAVLLLLAQPALTLRLVGRVRSLPAALLPLATLAYAGVGSALALTLAGGATDVSPALVAGALVYFLGVDGLAAWYLIAEARERRGAAKARLVTAAIGTLGLALSLLLASGGQGGAGNASLIEGVGQALALIAALGYLAAFLPPGRLLRLWQAAEATAYTARLVAAPADESRDASWGRLADIAASITGDWSGVVVGSPDAPSVLVATSDGTTGSIATYPAGALEALDPALGTRPGATTDDPIRADVAVRGGGPYVSVVPVGGDAAVLINSARPSLFGGDDLALLRVLGAQTAMLVERRALLDEQEAQATRLAETIAALEAASAAKSDFLASMSHELRTPLNAIIGFSELMRSEPRAADQVAVPLEWVEHIHRSGQHLLGLINDVLDLAKVEAGRLELSREPVELSGAVAESLAGLAPLAERQGVTLTADVPPVVVTVDRGRLRQVLYNLLSNAIKYTPAGGRVAVEGATDGRTARITVADTGIGIAAADQARVFEEFQQVGDPVLRQPGTGLGLALTRRLVEAHGGRVELASTLGVGSRFTVVLPDAVVGAAAALTPPAELPLALGSDILVIEDDPAAVRLLRTYLEGDGYPVRVAPDGERGLAEARRVLPAAIILDVLLPGIDGWDVLRSLKADDRLRDVPVVIVTVVDEREVGLALGAVDYFLKPVDREALLARLAHYTFTTKVKTRPVRILAVDDEAEALDLVAAALEPSGFEVQRASGGAQALALARAEPFDLVICDLVMPGLDGFEVVGRLKDDPATARTPILILTGHELSEADKARLNGRILGIVDKGDAGAAGLHAWLTRAIPQPGPTTGAQAA
jgi:signal transduction histidine kinase/DNA-binding response OmpR family regulator